MAEVHETDAEDVQAWIDSGDAVIVDVREDGELLQARLTVDFVHAPLSRFDPDAIPTETEKRVVFVCAQGMRSLQAAQYMVNQGLLTDAYNLREGIAGWHRDGFALESG
ncbi:MAG: rhodanese-like domain-containing protein [Magnetovibrio sp.]|nr:rhodanese-like domain-containing protein [Magnetovibrio sp.]